MIIKNGYIVINGELVKKDILIEMELLKQFNHVLKEMM